MVICRNAEGVRGREMPGTPVLQHICLWHDVRCLTFCKRLSSQHVASQGTHSGQNDLENSICRHNV